MKSKPGRTMLPRNCYCLNDGTGDCNEQAGKRCLPALPTGRQARICSTEAGRTFLRWTLCAIAQLNKEEVFMNRLRLIVIGTSSLMLVVLCSCSQSPTAPSQSSSNLIENSTFEVNGKPSLQSWVCDTSLATIVNASPGGDGTYSLQLEPGWIPQQGFAQTFVSPKSGAGVYNLTLWMKANNGWHGSVSLGTWSQGSWVTSKTVPVDSSEWSMITLSDTLSPSQSDSISVYLSAGATEVASGQVLFTDINLQKAQ